MSDTPQTPESSRYNGKNDTPERVQCQNCGIEFDYKPRKRFCSDRCRMLGWQSRTFKKFTGSDGTEMLVRIKPKGTKPTTNKPNNQGE